MERRFSIGLAPEKLQTRLELFLDRSPERAVYRLFAELCESRGGAAGLQTRKSRVICGLPQKSGIKTAPKRSRPARLRVWHRT